MPARATSASAPTTSRRRAGKPLAELACPTCGNRGTFTEPRNFNGLLKTHLGPVEDGSGLAYLRPETAQGIFINYLNVQQSARKKPPFGIGQIGKSFRNEITPGNFIFRTREFEQMEMEFFVKPGEDAEWHEYWIERADGLVRRPRHRRRSDLRLYEHPKEKLSPLLERAPSTSSTASASRAASGASSRASPTAPTTT